MKDKVKTSILIDRELWEEFKAKVSGERGARLISRAVEEAIEEELTDRVIIEALEEILGRGRTISLTVTPVKTRVKTNSGEVVRELREGRY